jgi:hypothetical protein
MNDSIVPPVDNPLYQKLISLKPGETHIEPKGARFRRRLPHFIIDAASRHVRFFVRISREHPNEVHFIHCDPQMAIPF